MSRYQCNAQIEVWGHEGGGSTTICRGTTGHHGPHYADWIDSHLVWDDEPQCGAWCPEREGASYRVCLERAGHGGFHTSRKEKDLKVAWNGDARERFETYLRPGVYVADRRTHELLYGPSADQQAQWATEQQIQDFLLRDKPSPHVLHSLGAPRTYAERKARRKKAN